MRRNKKTREQESKKVSFSRLLFFCIFTSLFLFTVHCSLFTVNPVLAEETYTLKAGVSIDKVPKEIYGTWRVSSKRISTNSPGVFKESTVDLWNLSRAGNVITLDNPFSGAHASIMFNEVTDKKVKFEKVGAWENSQKLTDVVELTLGKETFTGTNYLKLDKIDENGHVTESSKATYSLRGEKISGASIK